MSNYTQILEKFMNQKLQSTFKKNLLGKNLCTYWLGTKLSYIYYLYRLKIHKYVRQLLKKWKKFIMSYTKSLNCQVIFVYTWCRLMERVIFESLEYDKFHLITGWNYKIPKSEFSGDQSGVCFLNFFW